MAQDKKHYHFIAIGGSVMHNLALELNARGHHVTGSDDEIYEPAYSRLRDAGILPTNFGWFEENIVPEIDTVILGMHAQKDNPELKAAQEMGLIVQSFPEFVGNQIADKKKIVVCGSHGKTTTTSMIMHVLKEQQYPMNYLVGGIIEGFDRMVELGEDAQVAVVEGDEYPSSRIDQRPKMWLYQGDIVILTGIAWDHMNIFRTWKSYVDVFNKLIASIPPTGLLIYNQEDENVVEAQENHGTCTKTGYIALSKNAAGKVVFRENTYPTDLFGRHNLSNMNAARLACEALGIPSEAFFQSLSSFKGVGKRLEKISDHPMVFRDFAHSPSKVQASTDAIKETFEDRMLLAVLELHTYSSLNKEFLPQYENTLAKADKAIVFYDPHAVAMKRLDSLEPEFIATCFAHPHLEVINDPGILAVALAEQHRDDCMTLIMSSGNLGGISWEQILGIQA